MSTMNVESTTMKSTSSVTASVTSLHSTSSYLSGGGGSSKSCVEAGKQSPLWGGARFLPSGDCLPQSFNMALIHKVPMFPPPTGAMELFTHNLAEAPYKNKGRIDFDLTDPNNQCINTEYNPLTDPHMALFLRKPRVYKRLHELGQVTHDDKVRCSRKQYGQYASWLHHIGHQQFLKRADEERKKTAEQLRRARDVENDLKVAVIHTEVSQEEQVTTAPPDAKDSSPGVRDDVIQIPGEGALSEIQEVVDVEEGRSEKAGSVVAPGAGEMEPRSRSAFSEGGSFQSGRQSAVEERDRQTEEGMIQARQKRAARDIYTKANEQHRKRQKRELHNYQKSWQKYLEYLSEAEERRLDSSVKQEGWKRTLAYGRQYEDPPARVTEDRRAREERYRRQLQDEMNRRWQKQAGRLKEQKDKGRQKYQELEKVYTQSILTAFTGMPLTDNLAVEEVKEEEKEAENIPVTVQPLSKLKGAEPTEPNSISCHMRKSVTGQEAVLQRGSSRTTTPRSRTESISQAVDRTQRARSNDSKARPSSKKHSRWSSSVKGHANHSTYPTRFRTLGQDDSIPQPADEILIFVPQEVVQSVKDPELDVSASEAGMLLDKVRKSLTPKPTMLSLQNAPAPKCEGLTNEERDRLEDLIDRLLTDMMDCRLDKDQLLQLVTACAALTHSNLLEQATSTTSLGDETRVGHPSDTSLVSGSERKRSRQEEGDLDQLTSGLVEEVVRDNVRQLSQDLHDGTLSREDVRGIGSAVASAILGEVCSDSSVLGEEVVAPTLEHVLREWEQREEEEVDHTVDSILSACDQTSRRTDKSVWMVIKDFVVELLQRTGAALENDRLEIGEFHSRMEQCQKTALLGDMDLPCQHELMEVLTLGIGKLQAIEKACPVLCELVKVLLDQGHAALLTRHDASKLSIPKFDVASLEVVSASACGLEVALEVGATVADWLYSDMRADREFQDSLFLSLSPSLLLVLLTCWAEISAAVPKETVALQTSFGEVGYVPTLGEDVVLLALFYLWRDLLQDCLPPDLLTLLTLQVAQLPVLGQAPCPMQYDPEGKVVMSEDMTKKVSALAKLVREETADYAECQKLLSSVLQLYVRQGVLQPASRGPAIPEEVLEVTKACRYHMADLAGNVVREVLEAVLLKARQQQQQQQSVTDPSRMNFMLVTDILQIMSDCALADLKDSLHTPHAAATPSPLDDAHLLNVVRATTSHTTNPAEQEAEVMGFVKRVVEMVEVSPKQSQRSIVLEADYRAEGQLIKGQLGTMAIEVCEIMRGMVAPPNQEVTSSNVLDKMTRFLVSLLQECQHTLQGFLLAPEVMYRFLCSVVPSVAYKEELQQSADGQLELLASFIQDLQKHRSKSFVFRRLVRKLSKMSLDSSDKSEVAEDMAAIAQALSRVDPAIVTQFVQSTLYSLLASIRDAHDSRQASGSLEIEPTSGSTMMTEMERLSSGDVKSLLMRKEMEESTATTVSSFLGSSINVDAGFPVAFPKDSYSDSEMGVDANSKREISHEADIIIHMALQTMLERLGLDSSQCPALTHLQHSMDGASFSQDRTGLHRNTVASKEDVRELVVHIQDAATQTRPTMSSDFSNLDPSIAAYAHGLLMEVTLHMEDSEEECPGSDDELLLMNVESLASTILSKTFKSIETGLTTGKLTPQLTSMDHGKLMQSIDHLPVDTGLLDRPSLSCCVTNTLCAVRSELDLMDLAAGGSEGEEGEGPPHSDDTPRTLKRARQIVDFLIRRLQHDTQAARVEFRLSSQQKLSVVGSGDGERFGRVDSHVWTASNAVRNDAILQTFRQVVKDMQSQNQFFSPDSHEAESVEHPSDIFTLPSLPFLLDEFILSHLHNITTQFLHYANNENIDHESITKEAVLVACTLSYILREMGGLAKPASSSAKDEEACNRKKIAFEVLNENATRLLSDVRGICPERFQTIVETHKKDLQDSGKRRKKERKKAEEKKKSGSKKEGKKAPAAISVRNSLVANRPLIWIQSDLTKLLAIVQGLKTAVVPDRLSDEGEFNKEEYNKDMLAHAINQIIASLKKDNVADYVLQELFVIFEKDPSGSQDKDSQMAAVLQELEALATAVLDSKIPRRKLASFASEVSLLEKRHLEDPRTFAQQMRRVSLSCTGFSPEYLKMTVADLLAGYHRASDSIPESKTFVEPLSDEAEEPADDSESQPHVDSLSDIERPVLVARSSIDSRTISKINLSDDSVNRESNPTVYSAQVVLKSGPQSGTGWNSIIVEQSETMTYRSDDSDFGGAEDTDVQPARGEQEDQDRRATQNKEQDKAAQEDNLATEGEGGKESDRDSKPSSVQGEGDTEEERGATEGEGGKESDRDSKPSSIQGEGDTEEERGATEGEGGKESDRDSKPSSVQGEGDTEEERGAERRESKSSVETGKDSKPSSVKGDKTPASCDSGTREDVGDVKPEQGDQDPSCNQSAKSSRRSSLTDSERRQEGAEVKEATSESSRGHRSEEHLASPEGDRNTSAIRTVHQDLMCQMDEVKELEVLPSKNNLQSLLNCQHLCKQQNKNQNLSIHQNKDQNLCTQQNKNQHSPEQQSKERLSGAWQDKFFTVQQNESGCLPVQQTENQCLITVRQHEGHHLPVQPNRDHNEQSHRQNEGYHFPRKQTAIEHFPLLQNKGQPFSGQHGKNHNLKDKFLHLQNKNHLLQIKNFYNSKDTNQKLISQKTENQYLRGYQNVDQLLSSQESIHQHSPLRKYNRQENDKGEQSKSTELVAGCQQASETRKTTVQNMCEGHSELSKEDKGAKQGTRFLCKFRAAQGFSVQPVKTNMKINCKNKSTEGLSAYQGPTKESSRFSTVDTSLTPSNLTSQTKVSVVSSQGVSMPCLVSCSSQLDSVHSSLAAPTQELSRHAPAWHPYMENQRASKPFSSRGLTGAEKRAQQRAFESGLSVFDSRQRNKSKSHQKQTCNDSVNRVELECQSNDDADGTQPATQTLPKMSSSPTVSGQRNSVQSLVAIYQPSALASPSRSVQCSSAQSQELARSACKQKDLGTCTQLSADPHPPSTRPRSPARDGRETRKNRNCHHQHSALCSGASERSTLEERSKTKETPGSSVVLPSSLHRQSPDVDEQQRRKGCASQGTCAIPSVTFPRIPTPSSNNDVRKEAGRLVRHSVVADELTGSQPCGERTSLERRAKDILKRGSNSQSKLILPHPPKGAPSVTVDDLRFKLCNVLQGLKTSQRGLMNKQKHRLGSTTENPQIKSSSKTDSKIQYGARDMQPKTHTVLTDHRQVHHSNMKEFEPDKRDTRQKVHSKHGYMTSTIGVPGFVSQPKIPHPPKQPPPDQSEHSPGVNRHKETSIRWKKNPRLAGNVSSRQQTSAVDRAVSHLPSPGQTRHQLPPGALRDAQGNTRLVSQCPNRSRPLQCHSRKGVKLVDGH